MVRLSFALTALLTTPSGDSGTQSPAAPRSGEELIQQMRDRYDGKWYRTLTFVQKTTLPNGAVETWYEALSAPGMLRIDIAPLDSMNTILFRNDSMYEFRGGKLASAKSQVHPLMVLGFDVYVQPAAETVRKLRLLKFVLSKVHETTWEGRPTYVVGATTGDSASPQFWIDKERLYFVRSLEPSRKNPGTTMEARFGKYRQMGGGWLELEVLFLANGELKMREEYTQPKLDVALDTTIFSTTRWVPPGWVK
ncbi:MAG: hypothetical protein ACREMX_08025 [Gemmatimonadales bacterium]